MGNRSKSITVRSKAGTFTVRVDGDEDVSVFKDSLYIGTQTSHTKRVAKVLLADGRKIPLQHYLFGEGRYQPKDGNFLNCTSRNMGLISLN